MDEFSIIEKYFAPLARNFSGSLGLTDDAAVVAPPAGHELVITKDALSTGIHFIGNESPAHIAQKALRTNLSDLAAMGATPLCYFLALMLPSDTSEEWLAEFSRGLAQDQKTFGIHLAGGDTTKVHALSISITAIGSVPTGKALRRSGAKVGDGIYVSGTLGDSAKGLQSFNNNLGLKTFEHRYLLPQPRLALGQELHGIASACMDISDGLVQDMGHICKASNVGAVINASLVPLSLGGDLVLALTGGDDYELLFSVPPEYIEDVPEGCTHIGTIVEGNSVTVLNKNSEKMTFEKTGYQHF